MGEVRRACLAVNRIGGAGMLTLLLLSACSSGGGDDAGSAPPPAPPVSAAPLPPSAGPGDVANHFPAAIGDTWVYNDSAVVGPMTSQYASTVKTVSGQRDLNGRVASVFRQTTQGGGLTPETVDLYYSKTPGGVAYEGGSVVAGSLSGLVGPYAVLAFPVQVGPVASFVLNGADFGEDLDGDGRQETVDLAHDARIVAIEPMTVSAGTFASAARRDTKITATVQASLGSTVTLDLSDSTWFAPGAGPVRQVTRLTTVANGLRSEVSTRSEARGLRIGGRWTGVGPELTVGPAGPLTLGAASLGSNPADPSDRPAAATAPNAHLVISKVVQPSAGGGWSVGHVGHLVPADPAGTVSAAFEVRPPTPSFDAKDTAALAFGNGVHLAVFEQRNAANAGGVPTAISVVARRFSEAGLPLDTAPVTLVAPGPAPTTSAATPPPASGRHPAVAFGGGTFLVVTLGPPVTSTRTYVEGRFVGADGTVGPAFRISPDFAYDRGGLLVAYDGGNFVVAWNESVTTGWMLARVTPAGGVLDTSGVPAGVPPGRDAAMVVGGEGLLLAWASGGAIQARRYGRDLVFLDGLTPINVGGTASGGRGEVGAGHVDGEFLVFWSEGLDAFRPERAIRFQRVGQDGTVRGLTPPPGSLSGLQLAALASDAPPPPCCGGQGGYLLPVLTRGTTSALVAYLRGTPTAVSVTDRAATLHAARVHPFAR
jgi:hypothetical protein